MPFARTRSHEHAWGITGRHPRHGGAVNPRDRSRVAGGSSSGSAALVAAGVIPLALGTDTAGSIRIPASFCGIVGVKPTWGRVPLTNVHPLAESFDTAGILARTIDEAAGALEALGVPLAPVSRTRIGIGVDSTWPVLRTDVRRVLDAALSLIDGPEVSLPPSTELRAVFNGIQAAEVLALHRDRLGSWPGRSEEYGADVAERLAIAAASPPDPGLTGRRAILGAAWLAAWEHLDVLALPVSATPPTTIADPGWVEVGGTRIELRELVLPFTVPASLLGLPALSMPAGVDDDGLPVGLQLVARPGGEAHLIAAARHLETIL